MGFEGRSDYAAIGSVTNLASRLADEARGGQILIAQRLYAEVEGHVEVEPAGEFTLKGFARPVPAFNVLGLREPVAERPPSEAGSGPSGEERAGGGIRTHDLSLTKRLL